MPEVVYTADSQLLAPGRFAADARADPRFSPQVAWSLFRHNLRANYRRSRLGYFWLLLPPLATTATRVFLTPRACSTSARPRRPTRSTSFRGRRSGRPSPTRSTHP